MPRLHLAVKSRSADELTPGKELHAVRNEGGCSPTSSIRGFRQRAMQQPPRETNAQQFGRRTVDVTFQRRSATLMDRKTSH
jgi:hypothetical protein